jgi:hypothetical protein
MKPRNHFEQQTHLHAAQTSQFMAINILSLLQLYVGIQAKKTPNSVHIQDQFRCNNGGNLNLATVIGCALETDKKRVMAVLTPSAHRLT